MKAETRDMQTGQPVHNVFAGRFYRPQDAVYVGALPGFSENAFALLGHRESDGVLRLSLVDAALGTRLFDLDFPLGRARVR